MKKKLLLIMLLLFPFYVKAYMVATNVRIKAQEEAKNGNYVEATVSIKPQYTTYSSGISAFTFKIEYDKEKLEIISAEDSETWDNTLYNEDGNYYVSSVLTENATYGICNDGVTFCGMLYKSMVKFKVKNDASGKANIKVGDAKAIYISFYLDENENVLFNTESKGIMGGDETTLNIVKNQEGEKVPTVKSEIEQKPVLSNENLKKELESKKDVIKQNIKKSNEVNENQQEEKNIIDNIKIEGYELKFSPIVYSYDLELPTDVNSIKVDVNKSNDNKVEIIGNENIKENDNKVFVDVTDTSGNTTRYTINIKYSKVDNEIETMKNVKKFYEKNKKIIFISLGVIGFIILVVIIVNTIKDKKLDDEFNKL